MKQIEKHRPRTGQQNVGQMCFVVLPVDIFVEEGNLVLHTVSPEGTSDRVRRCLGECGGRANQ
jgi:hypothetical protein